MTRGLIPLVAGDLRRTRGRWTLAGSGMAVGAGALVFFVALGLGAERVLLGEVFPIDQVEVEPKKTGAGLLSLLGGPHEPAGIDDEALALLRSTPGVRAVHPKLKFRFPASAKGGKEILGREIGTHEMVGDGIDPALVASDLGDGGRFSDPLATPGPVCKGDDDCDGHAYCERPSDRPDGVCSRPVPALVSRYLIELFDHAIAPSHGLPPIAGTLVARASGIPFRMTLGTSLLGVARQGSTRTVKVEIVGVSSKAIDLGITLPVDVVRRWNREFTGEGAAARHSSAVVLVEHASDAAGVLEAAAARGLVPRDTRARDVSVLISTLTGLLMLVAGVILLVAASNIAQTFRAIVAERQQEIGLYRALGARRSVVFGWVLSLAAIVGGIAGVAGCVAASIAAWGVNAWAARALPDFPFKPESFFEFPAWLWFVGAGFAAACAVLGALGPALRAARTDPARALQGAR